MNAMAKFVVERKLLAWALAILVACLVGWMGSWQILDMREHERLDHLRTQTERRSIEIMSQTLNGNLMGAVAVLGLIDPAIKQEALGRSSANSQKVLPTLESIARSYDADGVFIVAENGVIASSWDSAGKPSTNLNVKFRPYYQMAMQGMDNVYAAVSLARGDRSLYFSAPVFSETTNGTQAIGAVVARTNLFKVDNLLRGKTDLTLLLSPQGVVFGSSDKKWIGAMAGKPAPDRLKAIRDLKQFGNMFDGKEPIVLPMSVEDGLRDYEGKHFAVATAKVQWNDPFGDWTLVMFEDLDRTISSREYRGIGALMALAVLLIGILLLHILKSHYRQSLASQQLEAFARAQEASAADKTRIAAATVRLQRANNLTALIQVFLQEAHFQYGILQGVVYLRDAEHPERFRLAGSYACGEVPAETLEMGEGLLGQCAVERKTQCIALVPDGFATIRSGLGEALPCEVLLIPVAMQDNLLGVVEVALLRALTDAEQATFEELTGLLAMNIEIVSAYMNTEQTRISPESAAEELPT